MGEVTPFKLREASLVATPTFQSIVNVCDTCHDQLRLALMSGGAGVGKTTGFRQYCDSTPSAWYIRLPRAASGQRSGTMHIYRSLGGTMEISRGGVLLYRALTDQIEAAAADDEIRWARDARGRDRRPLLVIDEAQNASFDLLTTLRDLFDERAIGLVIGGNEEFRSTIEGREGRVQYGPLRDRAIKPIIHIPHPTPADIAAICAHHGIAGHRSHGLLVKIAATHGLRTIIDDVIGEARHLAGAGKAIETHHIETAIQNCQL